MECGVANEREQRNDDICAVLATLVSPGAVRFDIETLDAFRLDHAHHPDRLPRLLDELQRGTGDAHDVRDRAA